MGQALLKRRRGNRAPGELPVIYGIEIDLLNPDPFSGVSYTDSAIGMEPGSPLWDETEIFKDIAPCQVRSGEFYHYLNPENYILKADGTTTNLTNGSMGDVFIEFPKMGYMIKTEGDVLKVKMTRESNVPGFCYYAFTRDTEGDREKLYIAAYQGCYLSGKIRSLSGRAPTQAYAMSSMEALRGVARINGSGYDIMGFYQQVLLQCLTLIRYKNLNCQSALGQGFYTTATQNALSSGMGNTQGMYASADSGLLKCIGIEYVWGNRQAHLDGIVIDAEGNVKTGFNNFNDSGEGYMNHGKVTLGTGYGRRPYGSNELGFLMRDFGGSSETYFCDYSDIQPGFALTSIGASASELGMFNLSFAPQTYYWGRLMIL